MITGRSWRVKVLHSRQTDAEAEAHSWQSGIGSDGRRMLDPGLARVTEELPATRAAHRLLIHVLLRGPQIVSEQHLI